MRTTDGQGVRSVPRPVLEPSVDVSDAVVWLRDGHGLVGHGGWTLAVHGPGRLRRLAQLWRMISAETTADLVAFVSSVFDDRSAVPAVLRIPETLVRSAPAGRRRSRQLVDPALLAEAARTVGHAYVTGTAPAQPPGRSLTHDGYGEAVGRALDAIADGEVAKVVVSRDEFLATDDAACRAALDHLTTDYPDCWTFAVGGLMGATPEMLATRRAGRMRSRVLAGSLPRGIGAPDADQRARLAAGHGFAAEHAYAARSVVDRLAPLVALDDTDPQPFVLELPNIIHLATDVSGRVRHEDVTVLHLVDAIHPTAAVGGTPRAAAVDLIARLEPRDRGRYAGPVGWVDSHGDGEIGLALRCGQREPGGMRLYAGGGIVAGADPGAEVVETVSKMAPMTDALRAGAHPR